MPRKPMNKAAFKNGKDISDPMLYKHWADLHRIKERIKNLKEDLERDCKAYWKYDDLVKDIITLQTQIKKEDKLMEYK